jgi:hypothetical protein
MRVSPHPLGPYFLNVQKTPQTVYRANMARAQENIFLDDVRT